MILRWFRLVDSGCTRHYRNQKIESEVPRLAGSNKLRVPGTSFLNLLPFIATPFYPMCSNINLKSGIIKAVDDEPVDP